MIVFLFSLFLFLAISGAVVWTVLVSRKRSWYEFFPTFFWQGIMAGSFVYQYFSFDQRFVSTQAFSIAIFSVAIFVGDWIQLPRLEWFQTRWKFKILHVAYGLIGFCVLLHGSHLFLMPEIPLITKMLDSIVLIEMWWEQGQFFDLDIGAQYMELREKSSKLLNVPLFYIYLCHGALLAFAPFAVMVCLGKKRWLLALTSLLFFIYYSKATLAKGTFYLFMAVLALQVWFLFTDRWKKRFIYGGTFLGLIIGGYSVWVLTTHPSSILNYKAHPDVIAEYYKRVDESEYKDVPRILTKADHGRLFDTRNVVRAFNEVEKFVNFFAYRAFFVPVEVSHYWYHYYPSVHGGYLGFYGLSPSTRNSPDFVHPANRLGLWAYKIRFPHHYFKTARAYCSIDADAYARFGWLGAIGIALLFMLMRIVWKLFRVEGRVGTALYASLLFVMGSALPAASIFAMILANGVVLYFLLLLIFSLFQPKESF